MPHRSHQHARSRASSFRTDRRRDTRGECRCGTQTKIGDDKVIPSGVHVIERVRETADDVDGGSRCSGGGEQIIRSVREDFAGLLHARASLQSAVRMIPDFDRADVPTSQSFRVLGQENWRALFRTGANMLVIGERAALDAFVAAAVDEMSEPVWLLGSSQHIPAERCGTFVLYDASQLDELQQHELAAMLSDHVPKLQVISLSEHHLWRHDGTPSMQTDLYYRLNTICLEIELERWCRVHAGPNAARPAV